MSPLTLHVKVSLSSRRCGETVLTCTNVLTCSDDGCPIRCREPDIEPRAETDHPETVAALQNITRGSPWQDASRHRTRDLHHLDARPTLGPYNPTNALIPGGILPVTSSKRTTTSSLARSVLGGDDLPGHHGPIHMNVEQGHVNRDVPCISITFLSCWDGFPPELRGELHRILWGTIMPWTSDRILSAHGVTGSGTSGGCAHSSHMEDTPVRRCSKAIRIGMRAALWVAVEGRGENRPCDAER